MSSQSGMDKDVDSLARSCPKCAAVKQAPASGPLHPWIWPIWLWQRIHLDFAGPFLEKLFIVVNLHSKWWKCHKAQQQGPLQCYDIDLATHGILEKIVTKNGPQFMSALRLHQFCESNGIQHSSSSSYHPATNGEAERLVRTFKEAMKIFKNNVLTLAHQVNNFLLNFTVQPHTWLWEEPHPLSYWRDVLYTLVGI